MPAHFIVSSHRRRIRYWRLRSYPNVAPTTWADGQTVCLGAEADPDSFVRHLVQVFDGVRRILRPDGALFVNIGETYFGDSPTRTSSAESFSETWDKSQTASRGGKRRSAASVAGLQPGDRCGIPQRFALAMQASGWVWRDEVIWLKRSPMPASRSGWRWVRCRVKIKRKQYAHEVAPDSYKAINGQRHAVGGEWVGGTEWSPCPGCPKCLPHGGYVLRKGRFATTSAHEPIFLFVKGKEYFADSEAVSEAASQPSGIARLTGQVKQGELRRLSASTLGTNQGPETRLPRSYLLLSNEPNKAKHFAAYPTKIPRFCIEFSTSKAGCCPKCGACYAPVVESERVPTRPGEATKVNGDGALAEGNRDPERHVARTTVKGYWPSCKCKWMKPLPDCPPEVLEELRKRLGR